jgi:hypothetical protein
MPILSCLDRDYGIRVDRRAAYRPLAEATAQLAGNSAAGNLGIRDDKHAAQAALSLCAGHRKHVYFSPTHNGRPASQHKMTISNLPEGISGHG